MKSIWNERLALHPDVSTLGIEINRLVEDLFNKYKAYNPREIATEIISIASIKAAKRICEWRHPPDDCVNHMVG
jgi:hypothetical protein